MPTIIIPTALRQYAGQQEEVTLPGATVDTVLDKLTAQYPELRKQIYSESGKLRNFVNVYVNDEDVRHLQKGYNKLK
jgi:molybdopterin converting factor small subunit